MEGFGVESTSPCRKRIVVVGSTGSGKTTAARQLAERLAVPHIELDALNWGANWTPCPEDLFRRRVRKALMADEWIVDGNYHVVRDIVWKRADTLVWLDYSLLVIMRQLLLRTLRRTVRQEELWNGNRERFRDQFLSRDSLFLWALRSYRRRRREYPSLVLQPQYSHISLVRLRSPRETRELLATILGGHGS